MAAGSAAAGWAGGGFPTEGIMKQVFGFEPVRMIILFTADGLSRNNGLEHGYENYRTTQYGETMLCVVNSLPQLFCRRMKPMRQTEEAGTWSRPIIIRLTLSLSFRAAPFSDGTTIRLSNLRTVILEGLS
jgi:hypothetical protein